MMGATRLRGEQAAVATALAASSATISAAASQLMSILNVSILNAARAGRRRLETSGGSASACGWAEPTCLAHCRSFVDLTFTRGLLILNLDSLLRYGERG